LDKQNCCSAFKKLQSRNDYFRFCAFFVKQHNSRARMLNVLFNLV